MSRFDHLLIDGDVDCFAATSNAEYEVDWGDGVYSLSSNIEEAKLTFYRRIKGYRRVIGVDDFTICLSSSNNYRKEWNPGYKANRTGRKPMGYSDFVEWVKSEFPTAQFPRLEADDVMGILATRDPGKYTLVTVDKDLYTIPGRIYRYQPQHPQKGKVEEISEDRAHAFFMLQSTLGDNTDDYTGVGVKGFAGKKMEKYAMSNGGWNWQNVVKMYEMHGKTEEHAIKCAQMARILTNDLYNEETGEITPWVPSMITQGTSHAKVA